MRILAWLRKIASDIVRESRIPPPPFEASKKVATIMYGVWYERFTPDQAKQKAIELGFTPEQADEMVAQATRRPASDHSK